MANASIDIIKFSCHSSRSESTSKARKKGLPPKHIHKLEHALQTQHLQDSIINQDENFRNCKL